MTFPALTPEFYQQAITFLIGVGTLAANELKERWSLRRNQKALSTNPTQPPVDLSKPGPIEAEGIVILQEILSDKNPVEIQRVLRLVVSLNRN